jgi:tripartite-type tricarboxylate transporter receptor subunit TctC
MKLSRLLFCTTLAALAALPAIGHAQDGRTPLRLVVGYTAGGSSDALARMVAEKLRDELGTPIIVDNRPGAGGQIAADHVRASPPDGNTILVANSHMMVMLPLTTKGVKYKPADFAPVVRLTSFFEALSVPSGVPATSIAQWLALARKNPQAGNFGVPAAGSVSHFLGYRLGQDNQVDLQAIPYKGAAPLVQDLLGGQIQAGILPILDVAPHHQAGKLRVLAVNGAKRAQLLPQVPTLKELGIAGFDTLEWTALLAPAGTPAAVVAKLNAAIHKAMQHPDFAKKMDESGARLIPGTPAQFAKDIEQAVARYERVSKLAKIQID